MENRKYYDPQKYNERKANAPPLLPCLDERENRK
jgi:hypothetical protein